MHSIHTMREQNKAKNWKSVRQEDDCVSQFRLEIRMTRQHALGSGIGTTRVAKLSVGPHLVAEGDDEIRGSFP